MSDFSAMTCGYNYVYKRFFEKFDLYDETRGFCHHPDDREDPTPPLRNSRAKEKPSSNKIVAESSAPLALSFLLMGCSSPATEDKICLVDKKPTAGVIEGPTPNTTNTSNPVVNVWKIYRIKNCDKTKDQIEVNCDFGPDGTVKAELKEEGDGLTATIKHVFFNELRGNIVCHIKGKYDESIDVTLTAPEYTRPEQSLDPCAEDPRPKLLANISYSPTYIRYGDAVHLSFPLSAIENCEGVSAINYPSTPNNFQISYIINSQAIVATGSGVNAVHNFSPHTLGYQRVYLVATDSHRNTQQSTYVELSVDHSPTPAAVIANLEYQYHRGQTATNITAVSEDNGATFAWTVTAPNGVYYSTGKTLGNWSFDTVGDYDFLLEVTAVDDVTKNSELRSVNVIP